MSALSTTLHRYRALFRREMLLNVRNAGQSINPLIFYVIIVTLFAISSGADPDTLSGLAPPIIWVAALLATLLSLDSVFRTDYDDGSLEQLAICPEPFVVLVGLKISVHWLFTGLPLVILTPLLGLLFSLSAHTTIILVCTLLLGTPVLSLLGAMGAALTLNSRNSGALLALVVLPLYIPVLLFATRGVAAAAMGLPANAPLLFLAALLVLTLTLVPIATATALKMNLN
jgi:heme exporter protein B